MRKTFRFLSGCAIAALMLGGLASCEDKDIDAPDSPGVADRDITQYMAVTISAPKDSPFSRALPDNNGNNFEDGAANESAINSLDFFFFNDKGEPAAVHYRTTPTTDPEQDFDGSQDNTHHYITKFASVVVTVNSAQGANLPTQTICFANMSETDAKKLEDKSISKVRDQTVKSIKDGDYFTMSNSVYFGTSPITGESNQRICAAKISGKLFSTKTEADAELKKTNSDKIVDVYVERLAAKIGLTLQRTNTDGTATITPYTLVWGDEPSSKSDDGNITYANTVNLTFAPSHWFMNATSKYEYVTKRYGLDNKGSVSQAPTFQQIDDLMKLGGLKDSWNHPDFFRSYWGCSPSYYEENYPKTSADVNDNLSINYWSYNQITGATPSTSVIKVNTDETKPYFSYTAGTAYPNTEATGCIYIPETTTASSIINNGTNPAATVASAVILGQYSYKATVKGTEDQNPTTPSEAFFIDLHRGNVTVNGTDELHGTFYSNEQTANEQFIKLQQTIFVKKTTATNDDTDPNNFERLTQYTTGCPLKLAHPATTVAGASNIAARMFALQFTVPKEGNTQYYYYNDAESKYVLISTENVNAVNGQLLAVPGYLNKYDKGHAMFSIPIRHLGWGIGVVTTGNDPKPLQDENGKYLWTNMRVGDLGVVRNHVYNLTINSIGGLGTGIIDDKPIVPPVETITQFVAVKLNVLSWRVGQKWSVDL